MPFTSRIQTFVALSQIGSAFLNALQDALIGVSAEQQQQVTGPRNFTAFDYQAESSNTGITGGATRCYVRAPNSTADQFYTFPLDVPHGASFSQLDVHMERTEAGGDYDVALLQVEADGTVTSLATGTAGGAVAEQTLSINIAGLDPIDRTLYSYHVRVAATNASTSFSWRTFGGLVDWTF